MQIAQEMAGYSLGGADMLRRAMGKKIQEAMDAERPKFIEGAKANGVAEAKAVEVWNLLDKFANYGFNKSHAAAYAVVSYQTAWLKATHPVEFMAAVMNLDIHNTDKLNIFVQECRRLEIPIAPPCVNRSRARFTVEDGRILYALGGLKNVGLDAMRLFTEARGDGAFADLFDMARRVELRMVGRRALEMMARAGAFDSLEANRARVLASLEALIDYSTAVHAEAASGQAGLFGDTAEALPPPGSPRSVTGCPGRGSRRSTRRWASTCRATRSTTTPPRWRASACSPMPSSWRPTARAEGGRGSPARSRRCRAGNRPGERGSPSSASRTGRGPSRSWPSRTSSRTARGCSSRAPTSC